MEKLTAIALFAQSSQPVFADETKDRVSIRGYAKEYRNVTASLIESTGCDVLVRTGIPEGTVALNECLAHRPIRIQAESVLPTQEVAECEGKGRGL